MNRFHKKGRERKTGSNQTGGKESLTKERLAYAQQIYHTLYDYCDASGFSTHHVRMICYKHNMTPEKWFIPQPNHPTFKFKLRNSLAFDPCDSYINPERWFG